MRSDASDSGGTEAAGIDRVNSHEPPEEEMERLYSQPISTRQRREGLRRLGRRFRRWEQ